MNSIPENNVDNKKNGINPIKFALILIIIYNIGCFFSFFPLKTTPPFIDTTALKQPVSHDDYMAHYAESIEVAHFIKTKGRLWAYNPYHYAGYPSGIYHGSDNRLMALFQLLLGWINPSFAFNCVIFLLLISLPWLSFLSAYLFELQRIQICFYTALSILGIIGFYMLNLFISFGGISFVFSSFLAILTVGLMKIAIKRKNILHYFCLGVVAAITCFVHILGAVIGAPLAFAVLSGNIRSLKKNDFLFLVVAAIICILPNLWWLVPFFRFHEWRGPSNDLFQTSIAIMLDRYVSDFLLLVITILFIISVGRMFLAKQTNNFITYLTGFIILFIFSFLGSSIGMGDMQPGRFSIPMFLFAGLAVSSQIKTEDLKSLFALPLYFVLILTVQFDKCLKFHFGIDDPHYENLISLINANVPKNGRLHVHDVLEGHPYCGGHLSAYLPIVTRKFLLAGPYPLAIENLNYTQFTEHTIFNRKLNDLSNDELLVRLNAYNVTHLLVENEYIKKKIKKIPYFNFIDSAGPYALFENQRSTHSLCLEGSAEIEADYDKIIVRHASSGRLILKFHYLKTLKTSPEPVKIFPVYVLEDPYPFIGVDNESSCTNFVIYNP